MKKVFFAAAVIFIGLIFLSIYAYALDKTVTFEWDAFTGEQANLVNGGDVQIFQRTLPDGAYDYNSPVKTVPQSVDSSGNSIPVQADVVVNFPDGQSTSYGFVARAKNEYGASENSNEVVASLDLTSLPNVADLTAVYNKQTKTIDFSWTQNEPDRVTSWRLYRSDVSGGPYTEIDHIIWDGTSTTLTSSQSIIPEAGQKETYYFVVVAFGEDGISSGDSNEVTVTIDRRPAPKVINLRVTVE